VTALEPIGSGFSYFVQMRQIVLQQAATLNCMPVNLEIQGEELSETNCYDYAFSINVMEHVNDVERVLHNVTNSLKPGASYHFTAPNYLFPYEPHFNIPTLFSKRLTAIILRKKILECTKMTHPYETWKSLNWINTNQVRRIGQKSSAMATTFNRLLLVSTIERVASDPTFASRRSPVVKKILLFLLKYRIHKLFQFIPVVLQPIIDCRLQKTHGRKERENEIWRR
jgi:hypothetical protein